MNVEEITYYRNNNNMLQWTVWDMSGQYKIFGPLWKHYYAGTDALIYVVDATDDERRLAQAGSELRQIVMNDDNDDELANLPVLIFGNKQDLANAANSQELGERLGLRSPPTSFHYHIQSCSATNNQGLQEGLEWLARRVANTLTADE
jgi:GTPase SAR1 family protein